jgi:hypothetical protein
MQPRRFDLHLLEAGRGHNSVPDRFVDAMCNPCPPFRCLIERLNTGGRV